MKRTFRHVISVAALSAFAVSQAPQTANCQMAFGVFFAANCQLPCCHTKLPMPRCPLLRARAPRDTIASSAPILKFGLQPLHAMSALVVHQTVTWSAFIVNATEAVAFLLIGPPQAVRAPPTNPHLLAA